MEQPFWVRLVCAFAVAQAAIFGACAVAGLVAIELCAGHGKDMLMNLHAGSMLRIVDAASIIVSAAALAEITALFWVYGEALGVNGSDEPADPVFRVPAEPWIISHHGRTYPFSRN